MRNKRFFAIGVGVVLLVSGGSYAVAGAGDGPGTPPQRAVVHAELNSYQETPSVSSLGFGEFRARINDRTQTISYVLTYAGLQGAVTASHIHLGQRGVAGGVSAFLCGGGDKPPCPQAGTVTGVIDPLDVIGPVPQGIEPGEMRELIRAVRAGHTYVNVHTSNQPGDPPPARGFPGGEIRGQIADRDQREWEG